MGHRRFLSTGFTLITVLAAAQASAQGWQAPPSAPPPQAAPQPAQTAPPAYAPAPAYPPQAESPPGWSPPGYAAPGQYGYVAPMEIRYVEGRPVPAGYHLEQRARKGLVVSGSIVFGIAYFLSLSVAASSKYEPDRWLYAPIIGPFVDLGNRKENCNTVPTNSGTATNCTDDSSERFFLMADGLMQTAGATMFILGLALQQKLLVRDDAPFVGGSPNRFSWTVAPRAMGRAGYGLGLVGTF